MNKPTIIFSFFVIACLAFIGFVIAANPNGATVTPGASTSYNAGYTPGNNSAIAGNITEITLIGNSTTQTWQGYYGNVSGTIDLKDGSGNIFYNWSQAAAIGEVFASVNNSLGWTTIECFNYTANGSLKTNLTILETAYGLASTSVDGVDETFNRNDHTSFIVGSTSFGTGVCNNTKVFGPSGAATFEEVLLYDPGTNSTVFASILDDNTAGFDNKVHDFEMLVLENGHSGDTNPTTYYFYVELQ
jgi:hypothetical protein